MWLTEKLVVRLVIYSLLLKSIVIKKISGKLNVGNLEISRTYSNLFSPVKTHSN